MVSLTSLLLPVLLSAVAVFFASYILHVVIPFHRNDFRKIPREDEFLEAVRRFDLPPGDYVAPHAESSAAMKDPAFVEKRAKGPTIVMTLAPGASPSMAKPLTKWFIYCIVISLFAAYIASRALTPGADFLEIFRFVATASFMGYSLGLVQNWIWFMKNGEATFRSVIDGLAYAMLTGAVFGWMWPAA